MTVSQMHEAIGRILDDPNEVRATEDLKNQALNSAQLSLIKYLPSDLLTELQAKKTGISISASGYDLSGLDSDPGPLLPGKYVNMYISSLSLWSGSISIENVERRKENYFLKGTDENPIAYIFAKTLFLLIDTYSATADLYYIRKPKEMVKTGASGYEITTCELDESRHHQIVAAACSLIHLWEGDLSDTGPFNQNVVTELGAEIQTYQGEQLKGNRTS